MVVGLGVDLVEVSRVVVALERWGTRLVDKLMDQEEAAALPMEPAERSIAVALAIAGKEAVSKALGTGWSRGVQWRHVVVDPGPPPSARLRGRAAQVARARGARLGGRLRFHRQGPLVLAEFWLLA